MDQINKKEYKELGKVVHFPYVPSKNGNSSMPNTQGTNTTSVSNMTSYPSTSTASNGNHRGGTSPSLQGSSGLSSARKREILELGHSQVYMPQKKSCLSTETPQGPKYPQLPDSLVLYEHSNQNERWGLENLQGIVPVVVNPVLVKGTEASKFAEMDDEQKEGLQFLFDKFTAKKGGILAHIMGVGKTRTAIALIFTLLEQKADSKSYSTPGIKKCLIMGPKNAIQAWSDEFKKWGPSDFIHGIKVLQSYMKDAAKILQSFCDDANSKILILSYDSFKKFAPSIKENQTKIGLVICDEAHLLKNNETARTKKLKDYQLFCNETVWIGLTGTPFQNNIEEYANLVDFFQPGILGVNYKKDICGPITRNFKKYGKLDAGYHQMLLKMREDTKNVLQYAAKDLNIISHEVILCVKLENTCDTYFNLQHQMYLELTQNLSPMQGLNFYQKLDLLKKVCIHPLYAIENPNYANRVEFEPFKKSFEEMKEFGDSDYMFSRKINVLLSMVNDLFHNSPEEKIIVAAQSKTLLKKIGIAFKLSQTTVSQELRFECVEFDGDCSENHRKDSLKEFETNSRVKVLLLSCKAGATALTLISANHLFLLEPDWNPFVDRQTIGRIQRKGQERTVFIYRFLATGTIEELKFLNQLSKEDFDKFFKERWDPSGQNESQEAEQDKQLVFPIGDSDLTKYFPNTNSHINDLLTGIKKSKDNEENDLEVRQFAEELSSAKKYIDASEVPEDLANLKRVWGQLNNSFSFVFHIHKSKVLDPLLKELISPSDADADETF